jgi:hypothetical protein
MPLKIDPDALRVVRRRAALPSFIRHQALAESSQQELAGDEDIA